MILKGSAGGYRVQAYNPHILEAVGEDCEFQVIPATQKILVQKKQQKNRARMAVALGNTKKEGWDYASRDHHNLQLSTVIRMQPWCSMLTKRIAFKTSANVLFQEIISSMASFQFRNMKETGHLNNKINI